MGGDIDTGYRKRLSFISVVVVIFIIGEGTFGSAVSLQIINLELKNPEAVLLFASIYWIWTAFRFNQSYSRKINVFRNSNIANNNNFSLKLKKNIVNELKDLGFKDIDIENVRLETEHGSIKVRFGNCFYPDNPNMPHREIDKYGFTHSGANIDGLKVKSKIETAMELRKLKAGRKGLLWSPINYIYKNSSAVDTTSPVLFFIISVLCLWYKVLVEFF